MVRDNENSEVEKYRRWTNIKRKEQAKTEAAERDDAAVVERDGVIALADEIEQDDEWVVMDDCPDDLQLSR